ncbi:hypothetical protein C0966_17350 (plasmid) [Bacillus methanolicus]|uniref:homing endonuclease associated repeat-containing protein n=1 Tax=Bacillus methanolicus TaxID=1471 RepID=UPI0023803F6F|nr:hypothetical protein [Bacillus methanolicus]MDE3841032.1 hypothetical protein [Bacillus methanolicus]
MNQEELIKIIKPHIEYLTTVKKWDVYAKEHGLPASVNLIYHFGSWNNVKKALSLPVLKRSYTLSQLQEIALKHKEHFLRKATWDEFAKENGLPSGGTYINAFGSWQKAKEQIGLGTEKRKNDIYSKEAIRKILLRHGENFVNRKQWDEYAKEHRLPTYKTIKKHFDYDEILSIINKPKKSHFTKQDLIEIALNHKEKFLYFSMTKWDEYAKKNFLPSSQTYFKTFGSWKKAKAEVKDLVSSKTTKLE